MNASLIIEVSLTNIEQHILELSRIGNLGARREDGFLRASWSYEESSAMEYIRDVGTSGGLRAAYDGVGNLFLNTPDHAPIVIQVGSHLDTVPMGGLYDGGAGIIAGLEAILALHKFWSSFGCMLQLVVWRGEESATYGAVCKGSQAAFGLNDPRILLRKFEGTTLEEAILGQGFDPGYIADRRPTLTQTQVDAIMAHIELHIEQANMLQAEKKDIGIVTSIRGAVRLRVVVTGEAAHSGGTPMGAKHRRDANLAMAYMQVELDRLANQFIAGGADLVQTAGVINSDLDYNLHDPRVYENAYTKVSPFGYFTLDIRSNQAATLREYMQEARHLIEQQASKLGVSVKIIELNALTPTESLDSQLQDILAEGCKELGLSFVKMPSGALHDAAIVASRQKSDGSPIAVAMIFIPCKDGISHNPKEYTSPHAVQKGAQALAWVLYRLTSQKDRITEL